MMVINKVRLLLIVTIVAVILFVLTTPLFVYSADWNFTPDDYKALKTGGGDLAYDKDSDWLPKELKDNLKTTLDELLDPKNGKRNTAGVNLKDFYHGHVVCQKPCTEELKKARKAFDAVSKKVWDFTPTKENFKEFQELVEAEKKAGAELLNKFFKSECGVVYHTYEKDRPKEMGSDDPRRNLFTPNGGKPTEFKGNDSEAIDNYQKKYCLLLQIDFLIGKDGKIHVVPTNFDRLKVVTGP